MKRSLRGKFFIQIVSSLTMMGPFIENWLQTEDSSETAVIRQSSLSPRPILVRSNPFEPGTPGQIRKVRHLDPTGN
jgi:hypothetical protein